MSVIGSNILAGASGNQGYQISRSVRLRSSASAYFSRSAYPVASAGTQWTFSMWVKRGTIGTQTDLFSFVSTTGAAQQAGIQFDSNNAIRWWQYASGTYQFQKVTTAVFRDPCAWYHLVFVYDTTLATATDRCQIWINGVRQTAFSTSTDPTQNLVTYYKTGTLYPYIGAENRNASSALSTFDGYLTEINFIDGQALTPSSFGEFNAVTGVWQPKRYGGTYGTNGFYLNFFDNSAATAAAIGKDSSGNGNNWTPNNISVTAGATYDSMIDVPTLWADGGNNRGNYPVLNPLGASTPSVPVTLSNANLTAAYNRATNDSWVPATITIPSTGKWYWEWVQTADTTTGNPWGFCGVMDVTANRSTQNPTVWRMIIGTNGNKSSNLGASVAYGSAGALNDIFGVAVDMDNGKIFFSKNNTWQGSADPVAGTNAAFTDLVSVGSTWVPAFYFAGDLTGTVNINFGQRPFSYTPPSGFKALNTYNLPTPTISNGANYMAATLYTGTGASQSINNAVNNVSFQPDFIWLKSRSVVADHALMNSVVGATLALSSNNTGAEFNQSANFSSFNSNGFTVQGTSSAYNQNTTTYVGWQWKANGTGVTNTSGSITSTVSVNTTAGFSVVTYTGTGANATVGHGLGVAPKMIFFKSRSAVLNWCVFAQAANAGAGQGGYLNLNLTAAYTADTTLWNNTAPTSSVFSLGTNAGANQNTGTYVAYCFAEIAGYSKFGSYTGNASADGPFVFCGFRPRFVMFKRTDAVSDWAMYDTSRNTYNETNLELDANLSGAEFSTTGTRPIDILSNGFKLRGTNGGGNASGGTYIFMAFAENPMKFSLAR